MSWVLEGSDVFKVILEFSSVEVGINQYAKPCLYRLVGDVRFLTLFVYSVLYKLVGDGRFFDIICLFYCIFITQV